MSQMLIRVLAHSDLAQGDIEDRRRCSVLILLAWFQSCFGESVELANILRGHRRPWSPGNMAADYCQFKRLIPGKMNDCADPYRTIPSKKLHFELRFAPKSLQSQSEWLVHSLSFLHLARNDVQNRSLCIVGVSK
jgi:hypothetical protein